MAESVFFILLSSIIAITFMVFFDLTYIDPRWIIGFLVLLLIPGFYATLRYAPWVPSSRKRHETMLKLAKLKKTDVVYDLGCGDGRLVFSAAPHAKKAIGYDLSIPLILWGKFRSLFAKGHSEIRFGNLLKQDYSDADVIFCYLFPGLMQQFYKKIWPTLKPGTRLISNAFRLKEIEPIQKEEKVYLYQK